MPFLVAVEVENLTNKKQTVTIPAGRVFMPKSLGKAQSLVVTKSTKGTVPRRSKSMIYVPTECIDPPLPPPANVPMSMTIFGQKQRRRDPFRESRQ
jgi:hypothetical protein